MSHTTIYYITNKQVAKFPKLSIIKMHTQIKGQNPLTFKTLISDKHTQ